MNIGNGTDVREGMKFGRNTPRSFPLIISCFCQAVYYSRKTLFLFEIIIIFSSNITKRSDIDMLEIAYYS